jgi:hypothetical protein
MAGNGPPSGRRDCCAQLQPYRAGGKSGDGEDSDRLCGGQRSRRCRTGHEIGQQTEVFNASTETDIERAFMAIAQRHDSDAWRARHSSPPGRTITETLRLPTASRIAISTVRGICRALDTSSQ